jgi:hypothetical protein
VGALIYAADPFHPKAICPGLIRYDGPTSHNGR